MTTDLADRLVNAIRTRTALDPEQSGLTPEAAYDIQDRVIAALGGQVDAAKLGLTSKAKQEQMKVSEPSYGWLLAGSRVAPEKPLIAGELIQPRAEPEIAFLIGADLEGPGVTTAHVLAATEAVMPAIDILDSRYAGYSFTLPDVIADNASAARYALGVGVPVAGINLRTVGCVFSKNGELIATAAGAAVLDHPAGAVAWFVRKLAERGRTLSAGSLVLAGALTAAIPIEPGDEIVVEIDRIGTLELRVA
ncbi:MAG TPA: fumarylacetoacetate hydrolase family protein [Acidimicrobiia bacterium]|nr:fumarylacetoacetate hydrolase family protein [Acidimicrobiia bacterium]